MFVPIRRDPITFREKSFSDASALQKNVSWIPMVKLICALIN